MLLNTQTKPPIDHESSASPTVYGGVKPDKTIPFAPQAHLTGADTSAFKRERHHLAHGSLHPKNTDMKTKSHLRPVQIGPYQTQNNLFVAPMAGITDRPFRVLCKKMGAGYAVSEMVASNSLLYGSAKTKRRTEHTGETGPIAIQLVGSDPKMLADAAKYNVDLGAQILDFNMGCPAKKICNVMAGSALMQDEKQVAQILQALVSATSAPVTLKIRTGWDEANKNALSIAKIAQDCGIQLLTIHGRTRAQAYQGNAEYDTIAQIKSTLRIPVIANGDIDSPEKAAFVLDYTKADGVMIGRGAQGYPWLFSEIIQYFKTGTFAQKPTTEERFETMLAHLNDIYDLYGSETGSRIARKHISWYTKSLKNSAAFRRMVNDIATREHQLEAIDRYRDFLTADSTSDSLPKELSGLNKGSTQELLCSNPIEDLSSSLQEGDTLSKKTWRKAHETCTAE